MTQQTTNSAVLADLRKTAEEGIEKAKAAGLPDIAQSFQNMLTKIEAAQGALQ